MASPVMAATWTFSLSITRQISAGSNLGTSTTVLPLNNAPSMAHCAAPWISGGRHSLMSP